MYQQIFKLAVLPLALVCFGLLPTLRAANETTSNANTGEGSGALQSVTSGAANTAVGFDALFTNMTGNFNTATGIGALANNTVDRNTATGAGALFTNNTGTMNTADGVLALSQNTSGGFNTAVGDSALQSNTQGGFDTAVGAGALGSNINGAFNTAVGAEALSSNTGTTGATGNYNTAVGDSALQSNTDGSQNTAVGLDALFTSTGSSNIALGSSAGFNLTTGDHNIDIGNTGVAGEGGTIRIGTSGTHTATFIAGINGVNEGSPTAVYINTTTGQLGTTAPTSSRRFKKEIKPMDRTSEAVLGLKPVTFQYKSDSKGTPQFGLIAEEVAEVNPDLVVRDTEGQIYTVRYDAVNAMLLNEFLKEHKAFVEAQHKVEKLEATVTTLVTTVKEQAAQIQKVSAQLEVSKAAPQVVANQ
jgi:hypothetical protein